MQQNDQKFHILKNIHILFFLLIVMVFHSCNTEKNSLLLPGIFSDNMVIQQNTKAAIWGKANAGSTIVLNSSWGEKVTVKTDDDGTWKTKIQTPGAGGPYALEISTKDTVVVLSNIMMGEVWLCSGQSNMEMPMVGLSPTDTILNATKEVENAFYPNIRMFTVQKTISFKPEDDCAGSWDVCDPGTAGSFSATAFFFAKKLHQELGIPVGMIHSSWGGSPVESWISGKHLENHQDFEEIVHEIKNNRIVFEAYDTWLNSRKKIDLMPDWNNKPFKGIDLNDEMCYTLELIDTAWSVMKLPTYIENGGVKSFDGAIWFRKSITIPDHLHGHDLEISLGPIDDIDVVYFNGVKIGGYEEKGFWDKPRIYKLPSELVNKGNNLIAIRMIDILGPGGICGEEEQLYVQSTQNKHKISLAGEWKYRAVAEFYNYAMHLIDPMNNEFESRPVFSVPFHPYTATMLNNAMIAPLVPFTLKGAIWYQGEANVGRANQYTQLLPLMIEDWRNDWQLGEFPFYYVQIAPYKYSGADNNEAAQLRDAQRRILEVPNTGMAVTLDIGNVENIHPANKKDVGERLALWALARDYGKELVFSGPFYKASQPEDDRIRIFFDFAENGLKHKGETLTGFEIAGQDGEFVKAKAWIENSNEVVVSSQKVKNPKHVRYAFKNGSHATLFNAEGLPASSFTTEEVLP